LDFAGAPSGKFSEKTQPQFRPHHSHESTMTDPPSYRWNTSEAAEAFDQAAQHIHPFYDTIQDQILAHLPFAPDAKFRLVDLGGGSGRLIERVLQQFPAARAVLVDQSEPFLAIAERRLGRFGERAMVIHRRLQDDWPAELPATPQAIVSTSAIHHLDAGEKQSLFARCFDVLSAGGVFINGDEYRPESDVEYLAHLHWWAEHMKAGQTAGLIPGSFQPVFETWYDRNIRRFGEPKKSGDDCQETIAAQTSRLRDVGFEDIDTIWAAHLWAIVLARKCLEPVSQPQK
jgi:ubiquinone/menaquinone biosynthesis C-methylase UbiE